MIEKHDARIGKIHARLTALHTRLREAGYEFADPEAALPGTGPSVQAALAKIENAVGPIPLTLRLFYERIGSVDFTGFHPAWHGCEYPDPIVVFAVEDAATELEDYLYDPAAYVATFGSFRLPIAPDYLHKSDVSGGMWYGIAVPGQEPDPPLLEEWHHTTFLDYLEIAIRFGGFPGLERCPDHNWPIARLNRGLPLSICV